MPEKFLDELRARGDGSDHDLLLLIAYEQSIMKENLEDLRLTLLTRVDANTEDVAKLKQFQRDFVFRWKFVIGFASAVSAVVGFLLSVISDMLGITG